MRRSIGPTSAIGSSAKDFGRRSLGHLRRRKMLARHRALGEVRAQRSLPAGENILAIDPMPVQHIQRHVKLLA